MSSLQIRFVSGKGWDSRLIEWYSRCPWSHVELLIDKRRTLGAQFKGGVKWRSVYDSAYAKAIKYEVWELPLTNEQSAIGRQLVLDAISSSYDWRAIFSFVLGPHRWHKKGAYICSGFVAGVLSSLGKMALTEPIENYTPRDIYMLVPNLVGAVEIKEGNA